MLLNIHNFISVKTVFMYILTVNWVLAYFIALGVSRKFALDKALIPFWTLIPIIWKSLVKCHIIVFHLLVLAAFCFLWASINISQLWHQYLLWMFYSALHAKLSIPSQYLNWTQNGYHSVVVWFLINIELSLEHASGSIQIQPA